MPIESESNALSLVMTLAEAGFISKTKLVIDVSDTNGKPIASIFPDDKYIQFHDEFTQIGVEIPVFNLLMDSGYEHNHS